MTDPAVGYTSGDDRKANVAGDEMTGPLAFTAADGVHALEAKVTADTEDRFTVEVDGTLEWGSGGAARDTNLYRGAANVLKTDDTLHIGAAGAVKFGASGDVDLTRTGAGELTLNGDLVVTGTIAGSDGLDDDLTDIGALTPSNDDLLQRKAGAWTNRTVAQVKTDLALVKADVGLGNVTDDAQITKALLDAKGDVIVASAADTPARLAVGTNGQVLTADSAQTTGVKWADAASGTYTDEAARDAIGTALTSGTGITITVNDGSDTITVAVSDAELLALAGLTSAADALPYFTGSGTAALATLTTFARTLLDDTTQAAMRTTLGLTPGTDVQAFDADLTTIAGLTATTDNFIQAKSSAWASRTVAQVKSDLGVISAPAPVANSYIFPAGPASTSTSSSVSNNSLRLIPWIVRSSMTLIRMGIEVTSSGQASSTFRLGIYSDNGNCYPGGLLVEAGSVAADSAASPEATFSQALTPGLYWIGGVHQGAASSPATFRTISTSWSPPVDVGVGTSAPASNTQTYGYSQASVSGALPANFTSSVTTSSGAVRVFVKVQ